MASSNVLISINDLSIYDILSKWLTIDLKDAEELKQLSRKPPYCRTFPIEIFPCRIYIVDYDEMANRIRIWLEDRETHIEKCSDYMNGKYNPKSMDPCWVCKWVDINPTWLVDLKTIQETSTTILPDFYRINGDREVTFGDGGYSFKVFPVWIHNELPIKESRRQRLLDVLYQLNDQRRDFHPEPSPVEDIIDPDLLAYRPSSFDRDKWITRQRDSLERIRNGRRTFDRDLAEGVYDNLSEHEKLRDSYQWLPSEFVIDTRGYVDIRTPIQHLPVTPEYRQAYGDIARIFHSMLPMFEKLKILKVKSDQEQRLQVIVKAQSYNLKAGMTYTGRWHTEGQTENIVAVGVYYLHIDELLEGGALKFRPKLAPQPWYGSMETDQFVSNLKTGAAIVFSNSVPHRFEEIRNFTTENERRRTFLNFFIVDPDRQIPMRSDQIVRAPQDFILFALEQWSRYSFPDLVLTKIIDFLNFPSVWSTEQEAKEYRARVRRAMLQEKSGWGWICWGNCGTTEFVRALCVLPGREREEIHGDLKNSA